MQLSTSKPNTPLATQLQSSASTRCCFNSPGLQYRWQAWLVSLLAWTALPLCSSSCSPVRPPLTVYAPRFISTYNFSIVLSFASAHMVTAASCNATYSCLLRTNALAPIKENSLQRLDSRTYQLRADVLQEGLVEVLVNRDMCDPVTQPLTLNATADFTAPRVNLTLLTTPRLSNATFNISVEFTEQVRPVYMSDFKLSNVLALSLARITATRYMLYVEGVPGKTASIELPYQSYQDMAGNKGQSSNSLVLEVPSPFLGSLASAAQASNGAVLAFSLAACSATAVILPGWGTVACAAGVLRSLGHVQLLAYSKSLAMNAPPAWYDMTDSLSYMRLGFMPDSLTKWAGELSHRSEVVSPLMAAPPPPIIRNASDANLDIVLVGLMSSAPYLSFTNTSSAASINALVETSFRYAALEEMPTMQAEAIRAAWQEAFSATIISGILLLAVLLCHTLIAMVTDLDLRLTGYSVYIAFPKLLLIVLIFMMPPLVYNSAAVFSWEGKAAGALAWALLIAIVVLAAAAYLVLFYLVLKAAPQRLVSPATGASYKGGPCGDSGVGATGSTPRPSSNQVRPVGSDDQTLASGYQGYHLPGQQQPGVQLQQQQQQHMLRYSVPQPQMGLVSPGLALAHVGLLPLQPMPYVLPVPQFATGMGMGMGMQPMQMAPPAGGRSWPSMNAQAAAYLTAGATNASAPHAPPIPPAAPLQSPAAPLPLPEWHSSASGAGTGNNSGNRHAAFNQASRPCAVGACVGVAAPSPQQTALSWPRHICTGHWNAVLPARIPTGAAATSGLLKGSDGRLQQGHGVQDRQPAKLGSGTSTDIASWIVQHQGCSFQPLMREAVSVSQASALPEAQRQSTSSHHVYRTQALQGSSIQLSQPAPAEHATGPALSAAAVVAQRWLRYPQHTSGIESSAAAVCESTEGSNVLVIDQSDTQASATTTGGHQESARHTPSSPVQHMSRASRIKEALKSRHVCITNKLVRGWRPGTQATAADPITGQSFSAGTHMSGDGGDSGQGASVGSQKGKQLVARNWMGLPVSKDKEAQHNKAPPRVTQSVPTAGSSDAAGNSTCVTTDAGGAGFALSSAEADESVLVFRCAYGFLVADALGVAGSIGTWTGRGSSSSHSVTAVSAIAVSKRDDSEARVGERLQPRVLAFNAAAFAKAGVCAGLLGGWAGAGNSTAQMCLLIGVHAIWIQYLLIGRPLASWLELICELLLSVVQLCLPIFAWGTQSGNARMAVPPIVMCIVFLCAGIAGVICLESYRSGMLVQQMVQQLRMERNKQEAGAEVANARAREAAAMGKRRWL